eukprot:282417_1
MSMWNTFWNTALSLFSAPEKEKCKIWVNGDWRDGIVIAGDAHKVDVKYSGGKDGYGGTIERVRRTSTIIRFTQNEEQQLKEALVCKRPLLFKKYKATVSSNDSRPIISRIGRIKAKCNDQYPVYATATIFDYDDKNQIVFVITSAHNLFGNDIETLEFQRLENTAVVNTYPCDFKVHKQYQNDANDIVILRFKDKNNYYQKIFSNEEQKIFSNEDWDKIKIVDIYESDKINCSFYVPFKMFVYDEGGNLLELINKCNEDDGNMDEDDSDDEKKDEAIVKHYFRKTKDKKQFEYNSIVGGDHEIIRPYIGAAIITELTGGAIKDIKEGKFGSRKYGIVGIYTGQKAFGSGAVAINQEKCAWIDDTKLEMLAPSDCHKS